MFPAMFVFGDSLVDNSNNNHLSSLARSNYFPYGFLKLRVASPTAKPSSISSKTKRSDVAILLDMDMDMYKNIDPRVYTLGPQPQRFSRICVEGFDPMLSLEVLKTTLKDLFSEHCESKNIVAIEITKYDTDWKERKVDHLDRFAIVYLLGGEDTKQKALKINEIEEVQGVGKLVLTDTAVPLQKMSELDGDNFVKPEEGHKSFQFEIMGYNPSLPRYEIKEKLTELFKPLGEILQLQFDQLLDVIYIALLGPENENLEEKVLALRGADMGGGYKLDVYTIYNPLQLRTRDDYEAYNPITDAMNWEKRLKEEEEKRMEKEKEKEKEKRELELEEKVEEEKKREEKRQKQLEMGMQS